MREKKQHMTELSTYMIRTLSWFLLLWSFSSPFRRIYLILIAPYTNFCGFPEDLAFKSDLRYVLPWKATLSILTA